MALCKSAGYKLVLTYLSPHKDMCEAVDQPVAAISHRTAGCKSVGVYITHIGFGNFHQHHASSHHCHPFPKKI